MPPVSDTVAFSASWNSASNGSSHDAKSAIDVLGIDKFMWGSDFPHDEGTAPFSKEALRQVFSAWPEADMRKILAENAAGIYGFDLDVLAGPASQLGPLVSEVAQPLTELPADANEALLRNAAAA
jgi:hypothetical protein